MITTIYKMSNKGIEINKESYQNIKTYNITTNKSKHLDNINVVYIFLIDKNNDVKKIDITPNDKYHYDIFIYEDEF